MNVDLGAVFGIGVLTLATPCVLPLLPIYLGMLLGSGLDAVREPGGRARLLVSAAAFSVGFGLVFTALGLGASAVGGFLAEHREALTLAGGVLIVLFGLKLLGLLRVRLLDRELRLPELRTGRRLVDAALFGVVFALGWTPCVGPILGSVLTYTASRTAEPAIGALYLATYSLGVATPLLVVALFADRLVPRLRRLGPKLPLLEKVTGGALVLLGVGLLAVTLGLPGALGGRGAGAEASGGLASERVSPPIGEPSSRPRIVEFYEPGCAACERARSRVELLREDCAGRRIDILALDAREPRNRSLASRYRVRVVPTFVLLDGEGEEQGRLLGAPELDELRRAAATLLADSCAGQLPADAGERTVGAGCPGSASDDPTALPVPGLDEPVCES